MNAFIRFITGTGKKTLKPIDVVSQVLFKHTEPFTLQVLSTKRLHTWKILAIERVQHW